MTRAPTCSRQVIQGFRDLADFLDRNPELPADHPSLVLLHFIPDTDADINRAEVDRIAALLGVQATTNTGGTHYRAGISFGPIRYEALAIARTTKAAHHEPQPRADVTP